MILTIDPGYAARGQGCACALVEARAGIRFLKAWFERPEQWDLSRAVETTSDVVRVVVEEPQWDERSKGIDPRVLLRLTREGFTLGAYYAAIAGVYVEGITPSAWKGSAPKPVQHAAFLDLLRLDDMPAWRAATRREIRAEVEAACERGALNRWGRPGVEYYRKGWDTHNLLDALCMGAKLNGRMK